jgi:hypothetical protein
VATTFELCSVRGENGTTFVNLTPAWFSGETADEIVVWAIGSMRGAVFS